MKQLVEDFASYLYLQRPRDPEVLISAIREGISSTTWEAETFAFAESWDEKAGRYLGLRAGKVVAVTADAAGMIVKSARAVAQLAQDETAAHGIIQLVPQPLGGKTPPSVPTKSGDDVLPPPPAPIEKPNRFFGNVQVDPARIGRDVDDIAKEIIQHLARLPGAVVKVTVEIQASVPSGVPDGTVRTVGENCRTLKFTSQGFETE